jgi:hypothetical protein
LAAKFSFGNPDLGASAIKEVDSRSKKSFPLTELMHPPSAPPLASVVTSTRICDNNKKVYSQ